MKTSKFNIFTEYNGKRFVSNTLSKSLISIDDLHYDILSKGKTERFNEIQEDIPVLKENGIVVEDKLDEIGSLRIAYQKSKNSTNEIEFVVAPTMSCNFKCVYCFETQRKGKMTEKIQNKVDLFIKNKIDELKPNKVRFIWFGGEPLLCVDIVEKMSKSISDFIKSKGIELEMIIITNGYFATLDNITRLVSAGVNHFQITIDGSKESHDKRRVLHNGNGTYDIIYNNLKNFKGIDVSVGIRVNIDKNNIGEFKIVKDEIAKLNNAKIKCHPALVEPAQIHDSNRRNLCFRNEANDYYNSKDILEYYSEKKLRNLGVQLCYCGAEHNNSFAIDEKGNLYKCWNCMGYDDAILSKIDEPEKLNETVASVYLGRDPFTEEDCKDCPYIPICGGGCVEQKNVNGHNTCCENRYLYDKIIKKEIDNMNRY